MKISVGSFLMFRNVVVALLATTGCYSLAQVESASDWDAAYETFEQEAFDYIKTMSESEEDLRKVRQISLRDKYEQQFLRLENQLLESNDKLISEIEGYIKKHGIDTIDDLLLMRLSNLHFKRAQFVWNQSQKVYSRKIQDYLDGKLKQQPNAPKPKLAQAIFYSKELLRLYPNSTLGDQAHYVIAISLEDMGQSQLASEIYQRFLKYHASSPLADEIMWRLAEFFYDKKDLPKAGYWYKRIADLPYSDFKMKATYKLAAAYYEARNYTTAATYFEDLYRLTKDKTYASAENLTFYEDALEYLGIIYTKEVKLSIDPEGLADAVYALTKLLHREARDNEARSVVSKFLNEYPYSSRLARFGDLVIKSFLDDGDVDGADNVRQKFLTVLNRDDVWWSRNRTNSKAKFESQDFMESQLLASAKYNVEKGFATESKSYLSIARENYESFISKFSFSSLVPQARFELAQLDYYAKRFKEAATGFKIVADDPAAKGFHREAAYGYLWAETKRVGFEINDTSGINLSRTPAETKKAKEKMTSAETTFLKASKYYIDRFPHGERTQKVLFKVSELYFKKNHLDLAEIAIRRIVADKDNSSLTTLKALLLSAEISNLQGDWPNLASRIKQIRGLSLSHQFETGSGFDLNTSSDPKWIAAVEAEETGREYEAALLFENLGLSSFSSGINDEAFWRAAILFSRNGYIQKSKDNIARLRGEDYKIDGTYLKAANLQRSLQFRGAAAAFENFAKTNPSHPLAGEALLSAAVLQRDIRNIGESARLFANYSRSQKSKLLWYIALEDFAHLGAVEKITDSAKSVVAFGEEAYYRVQHMLAKANWNSQKREMAREVCAKLNNQMSKVAKSNWTAQMTRGNLECQYFKTGPSETFFAMADEYEKAGHSDLLARAFIEEAIEYEEAGDPDAAAKNYFKAWELTGKNVFDSNGEVAFGSLARLKHPAGFHNLSLVDWTVARDISIPWKEPKENAAEYMMAISSCESGLDDLCFKRLREYFKKQPNEDPGLNFVKVYLKSGQDLLAEAEFSKWANSRGWDKTAVSLGHILRMEHLLPKTAASIDTDSKVTDEVLSTALGYKELSAGNLRGALLHFQNSIQLNPRFGAAYVGMSELLIHNRNFNMSNKVLATGVQNVEDEGGIRSLSMMLNAFSEPVLYPKAAIGEDVRVVYAKVFNDTIQNRPNRAKDLLSGIPAESFWKNSAIAVLDIMASKGLKDNPQSRTSRQMAYMIQFSNAKSGDLIRKYQNEARAFNPIVDFAVKGSQRSPADAEGDSRESQEEGI